MLEPGEEGENQHVAKHVVLTSCCSAVALHHKPLWFSAGGVSSLYPNNDKSGPRSQSDRVGLTSMCNFLPILSLCWKLGLRAVPLNSTFHCHPII